MRRPAFLIGSLIALLCGPLAAQDRGLSARADALGGASWQVRFERGPTPVLWAGGGSSLASAPSLNLLGDYQSGALRLGDTGGVRLTGGLLVNPRPQMPGIALGDSSGTLPYAGIGYSSGGLHGEWGFSADLGLAAQGLGPLRLERAMGGGGLGVDSPMRLLPMIRLGMNLSF